MSKPNKTVMKKIKPLRKKKSPIKRIRHKESVSVLGFTYSNSANAMYISLDNSVNRHTIVSSRPLTEWLILDLDIHKRVVGIEILDVTKRTVLLDTFGTKWT